jgi:dTDP-4-dehydrorhamnose reductase
MRVLVLGATGMLGSMVTKVLSSHSDLQVVGTTRSFQQKKLLPGKAGWKYFDAVAFSSINELIRETDWVINCIGVIKPKLERVPQAISINSLFPFELSSAAEREGVKVIQIATDCVFSGEIGGYTEDALHDATDVYGKTKSLGEVLAPNFINLRCSIVGPEIDTCNSLLEWFLRQPYGATVDGFTNHFWNGITTQAFANLCYGIISEQSKLLPQILHIVPANMVSKYQLLSIFAEEFSREDLIINPVEAKYGVDRTLRTEYQDKNYFLWTSSGYKYPPTIQSMIHDLAKRIG